jgi:uncharacterized protein YjiS (DUF1127 family)
MAVIPFDTVGARSGRVRQHRSILETLREWRRRARGRAELAALDERMLRDIGLSPADAEFPASKPFWRE